MKQPAVSTRPRSAFTLLEILLALGLSLALLTAVYTGMDMYYVSSATGKIEVERAQLARSIMNRIAADIRSVVAVPEVAEEDSTDDEETSDDEVEITADPADSITTASAGVFGDTSNLVLHVSKPRRYLSSRSTDANSFGSDLQSVSYFLAGPEGGALQQMVADLFSDDRSKLITGLARLQGERFAMELSDESRDLESLAAQAKLLAPEVALLEFRYFDGFEWLDAWDSTEYAAVPAAIEIVIGFADPEFPVGLLNPRSISPQTSLYRLVVALPIANAAENISEL